MTDTAAPLPDPDAFLSGDSGYVGGIRLRVKRTVRDIGIELVHHIRRTDRALDRLAEAQEPRRVLVLSRYRRESRLARAVRDMRSDRHSVTFALGAAETADPALTPETLLEGMDGGKFQNMNVLLEHMGGAHDWTFVIDDDVELRPRFVDRFVALCEAVGFDLAQPAQTMRSHSAWRVTRRQAGSVARRTGFVEIGPVTVFGPAAAAALLPFPDVRMGWGLDVHWSAVAREQGLSLGVVDALPVRHEWGPVGSSYKTDEAIEEGRRFLAERPYVPGSEAARTLAAVRRVPRP